MDQNNVDFGLTSQFLYCSHVLSITRVNLKFFHEVKLKRYK